ncbi:cupin-like domain-containing protein [Oleiagrimonas citrea]|uniref:cupin-like domain-containing protein n=1 Tax=Oleiagrimonas citrea TaxID=1665687 RepID=UPI0030845F11
MRIEVPAAIEERDLAHRPLTPDDLKHRTQPLVLRGLVSDWPMVEAARVSDTAFARLLAQADSGEEVDVLLMAPEEEGVIGYNAALDGFNYEHHRVPVTQGLKRLAAYSRESGEVPGLAVQSALMRRCTPSLLETHRLPFLAPAIEPRLWIGNRVTTPVHFDEYHNIACVTCGQRRFTLFPPEQVGNLYIGPLDFAPTGAAISVARPDRPDDPRYPRLRDALKHAQQAELSPGDALYIPPMWWHHVASLQRINALVNFWWRPVQTEGASPQTGLGALLHAIVAFRSLPDAERAAWRTLLDHYVFDDADPLSHVPDARKGVLGEPTAEDIAALRERIRDYL